MENGIPDPFKNYTMKGSDAQPPEKAVEQPWQKLDMGDREGLRKLLTDELWEIVRRNRGSLAAVPAIREIWDRAEGKAGQAITVDATLKQITVNAKVQFIQSPVDSLIIDHVDNSEPIDKP